MLLPVARSSAAQDTLPTFEALLAQPVRLKPELVGVHPRVFVTAGELAALRTRARTTHRQESSAASARVRIAVAAGDQNGERRGYENLGRTHDQAPGSTGISPVEVAYSSSACRARTSKRVTL